MNKLAIWFPGSLVLLTLAAGCGSDNKGGSGGTGGDNSFGTGGNFGNGGSSFGAGGNSSTGGSIGNGGSVGTVSIDDAVASCKATCNKQITCQPSLANIINCDSICAPSNFAGSSTAPTCDYGALKSALDNCLTVDCSALTACEAQADQLCKPNTSAGTGGTSGEGTGGTGTETGGTSASTGGTSGSTGGASGSTGGTAGGDPCAPCAKAATCCPPYYTKLQQDQSGCGLFSEFTCQFAGTNQSTLIQGCAALVQQGASAGVPECQ